MAVKSRQHLDLISKECSRIEKEIDRERGRERNQVMFICRYLSFERRAAVKRAAGRDAAVTGEATGEATVGMPAFRLGVCGGGGE